MSGDTGVSGFIETTRTEASLPAVLPTIYDVARIAGVATSTVSRALSNPGRVSFKTAEHVRKVAEEIGYRSTALERAFPVQRTMMLAMIVADINNPVFHGMIRGAERTAMHAGYTMLLVETQESEHAEKAGT
jgi:DNA-binding LacI/PurR family transcriptional regulator